MRRVEIRRSARSAKIGKEHALTPPRRAAWCGTPRRWANIRRMSTRPPGRGTTVNPANRYGVPPRRDRSEDEPRRGGDVADRRHFYRDTSRSVLAENASPDVGFRFSLNPYRGCEHGCVYCYARPSHEYLGFSAGPRLRASHHGEGRRARAAARDARARRAGSREVVALSGNTDCYQPVERRLGLTRRCLEVFARVPEPRRGDHQVGAGRARRRPASPRSPPTTARPTCTVSITTLDAELARRMEPRAAQPRAPSRSDRGARRGRRPGRRHGGARHPRPQRRRDPAHPRGRRRAGRAERRAGRCSGSRSRSTTLFTNWLAEHYPDRQAACCTASARPATAASPISQFGRRMRGTGAYAEQIAALFARRGAQARTRPAAPAALDRGLPTSAGGWRSDAPPVDGRPLAATTSALRRRRLPRRDATTSTAPRSSSRPAGARGRTGAAEDRRLRLHRQQRDVRGLRRDDALLGVLPGGGRLGPRPRLGLRGRRRSRATPASPSGRASTATSRCRRTSWCRPPT